MKKIVVIVLVLLTVPFNAYAFEIAPLLGARFDSFQTDSPGYSYSSTLGYQLGGLLIFNLIPFVNFRTGLLLKTRQVNGTAPSGSFTVKDNTFDFPINIELELPMGLYAFGGIIYSSTQSSSCNATSGSASICSANRTPDDVPIDVGLGYNLVNFEVTKFGIEAEYDYGTRNLSGSSAYSTWERGFVLNALLRLGF